MQSSPMLPSSTLLSSRRSPSAAPPPSSFAISSASRFPSAAAAAVAAAADGEPSAASLKASFQSFAASLPPACSELMNVAIPQQILSMHAYLQQMPRFEHSVHVPGEDSETEPVDPATLPLPSPPASHATAAGAAAAAPTVAVHASSSSPAAPGSVSVSSPASAAESRSTPPAILAVTSPLAAHPQLRVLLPFLHSSLSALLLHLSTLKLNLQLLIPPSDDSNTFGVVIQTETLSHLTAYEDLAFAALERLVVYGSNRAKMASKLVKWPGIADYWSSVRELDEGMWLDGKCVLMECRETWMAVHDLLKKNEERLNRPEGRQSRGRQLQKHGYVRLCQCSHLSLL